MNIAIIGYGAMGQQIKQLAESQGHQVPTIISSNHSQATDTRITPENMANIDVAIEFSTPESALENIKATLATNTNIVVGTTGWYEKLPEIKQLTENSNAALLWSSNFSIGVNLYFQIIEKAAQLINNCEDYDIWAHEIHHYNKSDSPSGTAKTLSQILLQNIDRKTEIIDEKLNRKIKPNEIHFSSTRGGPVNFSHTIAFDSAPDTITITHSARSRQGYIAGALKAAEFLQNKKGLYTMQDLLTSHNI